jgi:hypothetical protein
MCPTSKKIATATFFLNVCQILPHWNENTRDESGTRILLGMDVVVVTLRLIRFQCKVWISIRLLSIYTSFTTQVQLGQIQLELDLPECNYRIKPGVSA